MKGVLHPLFVHLPIALLFTAFMTMGYWLLRGLATSVFENRIYSLTRFNTGAGVVCVLFSMATGFRDVREGYWIAFNSPLGKWLYVKIVLALNTILDRDLSCETWPNDDPTPTSEKVSQVLSDSGTPVTS